MKRCPSANAAGHSCQLPANHQGACMNAQKLTMWRMNHEDCTYCGRNANENKAVAAQSSNPRKGAQ